MRATAPYRTYRVSEAGRRPLLEFMLEALRSVGCIIISSTDAREAPFRISFIAPWGERLGVVAYAFTANSRVTRNRPADEHRFQVKYGSDDGALHELWQDPFGLYTTLFLGINADPTHDERGRGVVPFFVGADPTLNSPTRFFISKEFKEEQAQTIAREGWHVWEREIRGDGNEPTEVLVGGTAEHFLRYVLLERDARGEDQGHRFLLADRYGRAGLPPLQDPVGTLRAVGERGAPYARGATAMVNQRVHLLEREFELDAHTVLSMISDAPRLKMAVRGWVAEKHLARELRSLSEVDVVETLERDGQPDFRVRMKGGGRDVLIECKNVLRQVDREGRPRLDFMRTRSSQDDPCSRFYSADDFHVVAACLHATTERWEFAARETASIPPHSRCTGKLQHRLVVDDAWSRDLGSLLRFAAA